MRALEEVLGGDDLRELAVQQRDAEAGSMYACEVKRPSRRSSPTTRPGGVDALDADVVHAHAAVDGREPVRLRDPQQVAALHALAQPRRHAGRAAWARRTWSGLVAEDAEPDSGTHGQPGPAVAVDDRVLAVAQEDEVAVPSQCRKATVSSISSAS